MFFDYTVDIPNVPGKITRKKQINSTYVLFETERTYIPEKKYTKVKRVIIGKEVPNSLTMRPNEKYLAFFSKSLDETPFPIAKRSNCLRVGPYLAIRKVIKDCKLQKILDQIFEEDSGLLLDLAAFLVVTEENFGQYYPNYVFYHPLFTEQMEVLKSSTVSQFFKNITQEQIESFLQSWNSLQNHRQRIYISCDFSNKNPQEQDSDIAVAFDNTNRTPLFYEKSSRLIAGISLFPSLADTATNYGYHNIGFILDRGHFSSENLDYLNSKKLPFLLMLDGRDPLISSLIKEAHNTFETNWDNFIESDDLYGTTLQRKAFPDNQKQTYFHVYYSANKMAEERSAIQGEINLCKDFLDEAIGEKIHFYTPYTNYFDCFYDEQGILKSYVAKSREIEDMLNPCGYFCLVSSEPMDAQEALNLYNGQDITENLFNPEKFFLEPAREQFQTHSTKEAKLFVRFLALIIRNSLYNQLKDGMQKLSPEKKDIFSVQGAFRELEEVEMLRYSPNVYKLDHPLNKIQKQILECLGMSLEDVQEETKRITEILKAQPFTQMEDEDEEDDEFCGYDPLGF